tara:strand:- start:201 stop:1346 length:1146 start_codon:yes stop_codon:yes gene_type:complete
MLDRNNFFPNSKNFNINLKKTKEAVKSLKFEIENFQIPLLDSYEKNYEFSFSDLTIKKFSKYNNIVVIGMGGSILGTKAIYSFFRYKIKKKIFFFDDLDSNLYLKYKKIQNIKNSCFIVISKSGNTLETITNLNLISSKLLLKNKLIIISEIKSSILMNVASRYNAEVIEHKDFMGGRYSVLSEVGMFPASLMNLNITKFKNLKKLINNKLFLSSLIKSVSTIYTLNKKGFKNSVILSYSSRLDDLCLWKQQLVGESLGKKGKGITPIFSKCPKDHHSLMQLYLDGPKDKFFTFFSSVENKNNKINSILNSQCKATMKVFRKKNIPYRHFLFKKTDESELGLTFTFFVLETILLARLMNINPFDQPAVEEIKIETKKILLS